MMNDGQDIKDWGYLTAMTKGEPLIVEKVRLGDTGIAVQGSFQLPPLAALTMEDQIFVAAFVQHHGSIKEMEKVFGMSYPTVKNRLNRICGSLGFLDAIGAAPNEDILEKLDKGEITVDKAVEELGDS